MTSVSAQRPSADARSSADWCTTAGRSTTKSSSAVSSIQAKVPGGISPRAIRWAWASCRDSGNRRTAAAFILSVIGSTGRTNGPLRVAGSSGGAEVLPQQPLRRGIEELPHLRSHLELQVVKAPDERVARNACIPHELRQVGRADDLPVDTGEVCLWQQQFGGKRVRGRFLAAARIVHIVMPEGEVRQLVGERPVAAEPVRARGEEDHIPAADGGE